MLLHTMKQVYCADGGTSARKREPLPSSQGLLFPSGNMFQSLMTEAVSENCCWVAIRSLPSVLRE